MPNAAGGSQAAGAGTPSSAPLGTELTFDEMLRARQVFILHTDEYICSPFELRTILSELGQYPSDAELSYCVEAFENKMSFNNFTTYLSFLKKRFKKPEPQDGDTLRAFVALGGGADRRGDINAENLRNACRHFDLTIDIDAMIREVDDDNSGKLEFNEFKSMWTAGGDHHAPAAAAGSSAAGGEELEVDDATLGGTLRSASAAAAARAAAASGVKQEEEVEPEEDTVELLKQHLFPNANSNKKADAGRKAAAKRSSMIPSQRATILPSQLRDVVATTGAGGLNSTDKSAKEGGAGGLLSDDESEDADTPQAYLRNQYKPPSPVILSMRNVKPPTKIRSGGRNSSTTPRRGGHHSSIGAGSIKMSSKPSPRASPRK